MFLSGQDGSGTRVKNADTLFSLYENAVGRNAVLLLNVPPNQDGVLSEPDVAALDAFGTLVRKTYGANLLTAGQAAAKLNALVDGNPSTDWTPGDKQKTGELVLTSPHDMTFNRVLLRENLRKGQRIELVSVSAQMANGKFKEIATAGSIGYKRILPLSTTITTRAIKVTIKQSRAQPFLGSVELYLKQ